MPRNRFIIATAVALAALVVPSAANAADRDHDRMRDSWEKHFRLNTHKNDARKDKDRDGLKNIEEYRGDTNPRRRDSDNDGVRDSREGAGTIKSFDSATGVLVIDLFGSDSDLTGKVDSSTKIECEDEGDDDDRPTTGNTTGDTRGDGTPEDRAARDGSDNSGPGNAEDGDRQEDNSGPGNASDDDRRHGDDDRGDDDEREFACNADWLDVGRTVKEAELNEGDDGPADVFDEIELIAR